MRDLVLLGIILGLIVLSLFLISERQASQRALELKMFQWENTRIIQQLSKAMEQMEKENRIRHDENMTYFQGIMQSIAWVIRRQEEGEGPK